MAKVFNFLSAFNVSNCERYAPINFAVFNFISCCIVNLQPCRGMIGETKHERSSSFNGYDSWLFVLESYFTYS